jgi:molybdenum cofactor cytidylyltransferase
VGSTAGGLSARQQRSRRRRDTADDTPAESPPLRRSADPQVAGLLLAAGLGRRFGGAKLGALLDGRPLVAHVLATLGRAVDDGILQRVIVVAAADRGAPADQGPSMDARVVRRTAAERGFEVVTNESPQAGLSRSLRLGLQALEGSPVDAALVVLADQPRTRPEVLNALVAEWRRSDAPIVVPRYAAAAGAPGNPVLLARAVWPLAGALRGDTGMAAIVRRRPELVAYLDVGGSNPDVDRPEDLEALSALG